MPSKFKFIAILLMLGLFYSCLKKKEIEGIRIDTFRTAMKDYKSNKKVCGLVSRTLDKDEKALSGLINLWCGGGADCYELGFVLSQIVYKMGETEFALMVEKLTIKDQRQLRFWLMCGLEYGDHDSIKGDDNRRLDKEFPKLDTLLNNYIPERNYIGQIKSNYYLVILKPISLDIDNPSEMNADFIIFKKSGGKFVEFYKEQIHTEVNEIKIADFNGDGKYDILVQNFSDVRSNWTYYLYLLNYETKKMVKVKGFEEIKNPRYLADVDLVDNYVNSGRNWTQFHKIQGDSVITYPTIVYDGLGEEDTGLVTTYERDYRTAVREILKK